MVANRTKVKKPLHSFLPLFLETAFRRQVESQKSTTFPGSIGRTGILKGLSGNLGFHSGSILGSVFSQSGAGIR